MDVTEFVNDVIVGTAVFLRDFLYTAVIFWVDPAQIEPMLAAGGPLPPGLLPPLPFFVLSVVIVVLTGIATFSLISPEGKTWWLTRYLVDGIKGLDGKRLMTVSIPFVALFTGQAGCIVLVTEAIGEPVAFRAALALCCYFGGSGYLCTAVLVLAVLPQWARPEDKRFRPRWLWGAVLGTALAVLYLRNTYNFYVLLQGLLDVGIVQAIFVYAASLLLSCGAIGLVCLWAKPLIERATRGDAGPKSNAGG